MLSGEQIVIDPEVDREVIIQELLIALSMVSLGTNKELTDMEFETVYLGLTKSISASLKAIRGTSYLTEFLDQLEEWPEDESEDQRIVLDIGIHQGDFSEGEFEEGGV